VVYVILVDRLERFAVAAGSYEGYEAARSRFDEMLVSAPAGRSRDQAVLLEALGLRAA
jgi:hypothetical protein